MNIIPEGANSESMPLLLKNKASFWIPHPVVQFPNSVPVIVNLDLTLYFVTLIGRPQCNGRFCWQASLLHLRPSFSSTRMITRTIYIQDLSSGTLLVSILNQIKLISNFRMRHSRAFSSVYRQNY